MSDKKPVIFVSYSHKDEPEHDSDGDIHWLRDILSYVAPAVNGTYELWTDEDIVGGSDWETKIKEKLAACDICILLVSRHSLASKYVIEVEIDTILKRQQQGHAVQLYPIVLSPFPQAAAPTSLLALNLRPRLDKPLSGFSRHHRGAQISKIADEIVGILCSKATKVHVRTEPPKSSGFVHISSLPETAYERLVGRDAELKRLDDAWADHKTRILSLIAEGGAGKSALINEWLTQLQLDSYRGAETVLGWSFYSQGTKERATSAEQFLNWAVEKFGIKVETTSATAKGEAIAEAMIRRRTLLVLDGCEPLQHGLDKQQGELKDFGLRALLRRFAATAPGEVSGLIVLTSRLAMKDIARWEGAAAPVVNVERLSDEAGAALLRDNSVWGTDKELKAATHDFGGHALALGLLASFLKETQIGDVRRRDHIRAFFADAENPRHDHARRVMESYEKEWVAAQPVLLAIMHIVGLFDRPASGNCLEALRAEPAIAGLSDQIVALDDREWHRAIGRLREVRLLAPPDASTPDALDAHPLVREWFGDHLKKTNEAAWKTAHSRLYEHLRDTTKEGDEPKLEDLAPLYQAIAHGCRAGRHLQALTEVYRTRIQRLDKFYSTYILGANNTDLAALSWFFSKPYETPVPDITEQLISSLPDRHSPDTSALIAQIQCWLLGEAGSSLRSAGRLGEALSASRAALALAEVCEQPQLAASYAYDISSLEMLLGNIDAAVASAASAIIFADRSDGVSSKWANRAGYAYALHALGNSAQAKQAFEEAEAFLIADSKNLIRLYGLGNYWYCDHLIERGGMAAACKRALGVLSDGGISENRLDDAIDILTLGRCRLGVVLGKYNSLFHRVIMIGRRQEMHEVLKIIDESLDRLRSAGWGHRIPLGLLVRAAFRRSIGEWGGATRDLDEVEEIADPGPMKLYLCELALERARLAFARTEAFAPLSGILKTISPGKSRPPTTEQIETLRQEAGKQLAIAANYVKTCRYHRCDKELAELQAVLRNERKFADLPPRV
jgi:tetratricopeptide (TPR) repeat protein